MRFVFTGNLEAAKRIGLKPARRVPLFNGPIDCRLLKYELYGGSKREPRTCAAGKPHPLTPSPKKRGSHGGAADVDGQNK